jgi:hypothetical protein
MCDSFTKLTLHRFASLLGSAQCLAGEQEEKEKKQKVQLKKAEKKIDKDKPDHKKKKGFRIRKGVTLMVRASQRFILTDWLAL